MQRVVALVAMLGVVACASPTEISDADAGADLVPDPPSPPTPPALGECGSGRIILHERGPATCEPWAAGGRPICDVGQIPRGDGCAPLGRICGSAPRAAEGAVLHVDPSAPAGGDGRAESPLRTLAEALVIRPTDVTIRLSSGTHIGGVDLGDGVSLEGSCVAQTTVVPGPDPERLSILAVEGERVAIRDLRVSGPSIGVLARADSALVVEGVHIDGAEVYGLACIGCDLNVEDLWVRDVAGRVMPGSPVAAGYGMTLEAATVSLSRVVVERVHEIGVLIASGTRAVVDGLTLLEISSGPSGQMGVGLGVTIAAEVDAQHLVIESAARAAVIVERQGLATLRDVFVRDIPGVLTRRPAGSVIEVSTQGEALVDGLTATDVVAGANVADGTLTLRDARFDELHGVSPHGAFGHLLRAVDGGSITAERLHAEDISDIGLVAADASRLDVTDARVIRIRGAFDPMGDLDQATGLAALARSGASLRLTRAELAEATFVAAAASGEEGTNLELEDVLIRDVRAGPFPELGGGRGLIAIVAATVVARRVRVERAAELAVSAWFGGTIRAEHLAVVQTLARGDGGAGIAIGAYAGGHLILDRFLVQDAALCGVQLAFGAIEPHPSAPMSESGGTAELSRGSIERAPLGLNVQVPGTDLVALLSGLTFRDVDRRVTADALPVPRPDGSELTEP